MSRRVVGFLTVVTVVACLIALPAVHAGDVSHARIVRLSYAQGAVEFRTDAGSRWQKAMVNTPLREGMSLATGDGRAEVEFENGALLWMASNTVVELQQLALEDGAKQTQFQVRQGTATVYVNPGRHDSFVVRAGELQVAAPENAHFRTDVFDDGAAVSVMHGSVDVTARGGTQRVGSHKTLALRNNPAENAIVSGNPRSDAWDHWVSDRDASVEAARYSASDYLDSPYGYGMADLSFYGGWLDVPGYGIGWQPYGVGPGWSPFYNGYWGMYGGFGPTWISYEPWGWLPYHYGGWEFLPGYGWAWVPGSFGAWSPGTVFWVNTPGGIGWVARAPGEKLKGTPTNLSHGVITNTPVGMLAGTRNRMVRASVAEGVGVGAVENWKDNAALMRWSQEAEARTAATGAKPGITRGALRMPEGAAPRIATAGMYAGRVAKYRPPSPPRSAGFGYGGGPATPSFGGAGGNAPAFGNSGKVSGAAAPTHGGAAGGGAHPGKP